MTLKETKKHFKEGQILRCYCNYLSDIGKLHIIRLIPSGAYSDRTFVHYKVYGKHKQWWHEFFETTETMLMYIEITERQIKKK